MYKMKGGGFFPSSEEFHRVEVFRYLCAALNYKYPQFSAPSTKKAWYS